MSLSLQTKVDIRRHLGVPAAGYPTSGYTGGIRIVQSTGQLETYMDNLQADEESVVTGFPYGLVRIFGTPTAGNTVTLTINGTPVVYTVTENDATSTMPAPLQAVAYNVASAVNAANLGPLAAGGFNYGATPAKTLPDGSQVSISNPSTFTVTASASGLSAVVIANGSTFPNPQITTSAGSTIYGYVPICNYLEGQVMNPNLSLQYVKADAVTFRADEVAARLQAYRWACRQLGNFLSVGLEAGMLKRIGSNTALRVVV